MMLRSKAVLAILPMVVFLTIGVACGGDEAAATPRVVIQTVVVEKVVEKVVPQTVVVEKAVSQTVVVEKVVEKVVPQTVVVEKAVPQTVVVEKQVTKVVDPRFGGTMKVVAEASVSSLDSIATSGGINQTVAGHIYDQLFNMGEGFIARPQMVDTWSVTPDGLGYTMTLRNGMLFHDGTKVTSADVVASMKRLIDRKQGAFATMVQRGMVVAAVDERMFTVKFTQPYGLLVESLATSNLYPPVQPARLASQTPANEPLKQHIGSGPFKLEKWDAGASVKMARFAEYVPRNEPADGHAGGKKVFVELLEWLEVPDPGTRIVLLEAGQVDFVQTAPQDDFNRLKKNLKLQPFPHPLGRTPILIFNNANPPFNDVIARRAVATAIDAEEIMAAYGPKELWRTCGAIWGCGTLYDTNAGTENYNLRNVEKGKELLKQSKYDGRTIDVLVPTDQPTIAPITQIARARLEAIGLKVNVVVTDWATVVQRRGKLDGYHIMGTYGTAGAAIAPATAFATAHYCNCATDTQKALSDQFLVATSPEEKYRIASEKQRVYYQELPWYHLGEFFSYHIGSKRLQGYGTTAARLGEPAFWNVWLEK